MRLSELARGLADRPEGPDPEVTGITLDSRKVEPGFLFVAVPGAKTDGSHFVKDAAERGAVAVLAAFAAPEAGVPTLVSPRPSSR